MRRTLIFLVALLLLCGATQVRAITLLEAYSAAGPGAGYDKWVYLEPGEIYMGGLNLASVSVCLISYGATVDLDGDVIQVDPTAVLDVCGVVFANSDSASLTYVGAGHGFIDHCTFYGSTRHVYYWQGSDMTLTSNVFSWAANYGVYRHQTNTSYLAYNDAWENLGGHYMEYCPG